MDLTFAALSASLLLLIYFIRKWFVGKMCQCTGQLKGKTVLVTGCTGGIGKETARLLALRGARVILTSRDEKRGAEVAEELRASTGNPQVLAMQLDLADLSNVRSFATAFLQREPHLHVLINNAGIYYNPPTTTVDGHDLVFQTNHLGHFLLTKLLLERVKESQPSRIINVSSIAYAKCPKLHYFDQLEQNRPVVFDKCPKLPFSDQLERKSTDEYNRHVVYAKSKLAQILFTRTLAQQLKGSGVTVNALHPGVVETNIFKNFPLLSAPLSRTLLWPLIKLTFKTPAEGAQTSLHCAISPEGATLTGAYFKDCAPYPLAKFAEDEALAHYVWLMSERMVTSGEPKQEDEGEAEVVSTNN